MVAENRVPVRIYEFLLSLFTKVTIYVGWFVVLGLTAL